jgi:hypothetical protein
LLVSTKHLVMPAEFHAFPADRAVLLTHISKPLARFAQQSDRAHNVPPYTPRCAWKSTIHQLFTCAVAVWHMSLYTPLLQLLAANWVSISAVGHAAPEQLRARFTPVVPDVAPTAVLYVPWTQLVHAVWLAAVL